MTTVHPLLRWLRFPRERWLSHLKRFGGVVSIVCWAYSRVLLHVPATPWCQISWKWLLARKQLNWTVKHCSAAGPNALLQILSTAHNGVQCVWTQGVFLPVSESQRGNDFENCTADSLAQNFSWGIFQGSANSSNILFCTVLMLMLMCTVLIDYWALN